MSASASQPKVGQALAKDLWRAHGEEQKVGKVMLCLAIRNGRKNQVRWTMTWKTQVFCSVKPRICFPYCLPGAKDAEGGWLYKAGRISQLIKATRPAATNVSHGTPESKKDAAASKTKKAKTSDESETGSSSTEADESSSGAKQGPPSWTEGQRGEKEEKALRGEQEKEASEGLLPITGFLEQEQESQKGVQELLWRGSAQDSRAACGPRRQRRASGVDLTWMVASVAMYLDRLWTYLGT